ncbi:MAG: hypothetical protein ACK559_41825, partial [bacterium]
MLHGRCRSRCGRAREVVTAPATQQVGGGETEEFADGHARGEFDVETRAKGAGRAGRGYRGGEGAALVAEGHDRGHLVAQWTDRANRRAHPRPAIEQHVGRAAREQSIGALAYGDVERILG